MLGDHNQALKQALLRMRRHIDQATDRYQDGNPEGYMEALTHTMLAVEDIITYLEKQSK